MKKLWTVLTLALLWASVASAQTGLVAHWRMEEGSGTQLIDASGSGNHATIHGTPAWVAGKEGSLALGLDGSTEYGVAPHTTSLMPAQLTIAYWVKPARMALTYTVRKQGSYELDLSSSGYPLFRLNSSDTYRINSSVRQVSGQWMHVAGTYDGTKMHLYVNGVEQGTGINGAAIKATTSGVGVGGLASGTSLLLGSLDDVRIYNRALSLSEIKALASAALVGSAGNAAPTVSAGSDRSITLPSSASLDGTISDDGLPNPPGSVTPTWSKVSGPGTVTFGNARAVDTTATFSAAGSYVLKLAGDDGNLIGADTMSVSVSPAGQTEPPPAPPAGDGLWLSRDEIMALPMSGSGWTSISKMAAGSCGTPDLENQDETANVCILAKALVGVRQNNSAYQGTVKSAIQSIVNSGSYGGRALALGRKLAAYVIAADVIDLASMDPALDKQFRAKLVALRDGSTTECGSIASCHGQKPDNWGTASGASRIAVDLYVGDQEDLKDAVAVFKGYLGDRSAYAGFTFVNTSNPNVLSWSCVRSAPVAINPPTPCMVSWNGATYDVAGAPIRDSARGSSTGQFSWPPPRTLYPWTGMEGLIVQAELLYKAGYDSYGWQTQAIRRAYEFLKYLHDTTGGYWFSETASDQAVQVWLANKRYSLTLPASTPSHIGKIVAWTDWTHR